MLITCPSCGRSHDSARHRGAFEIDCDCGYSILIPDEDAMESASDDVPGFQAPPIAMDEEDNRIAVDVGESTNAISDLPAANPFAPFDGAIDMTPESELPGGMIYDPDEADALAESKNTWSQNSTVEESFLDPFVAESEDENPTKKIDVVEELAKEFESSPAQRLVLQNQSASLGHLVGSYFDLNLSALNATQLTKMSSRCEELQKNNPWIKQLVQSRPSKCGPEDFLNQKKLWPYPKSWPLNSFCIVMKSAANVHLLRQRHSSLIPREPFNK